MEVAEEPDNLREILRARRLRLSEAQIEELRAKVRKISAQQPQSDREIALLQKELEDLHEERQLNRQELDSLN